ncbi:MAG: peptidoglycan editing factor PgeF [Alphaproteobacteria bacterium]|jgi:YfiH family protein|nr:peptidoglycan editing factor PgeF [Alphaproteobacteria bacterium]
MNSPLRLQSSLLSRINFIDHAFFGRVGGVSNGVYAGLNTSFRVGDNPENVGKNRTLIAESFAQPSRLLTLNQVHSNKVIRVDTSTPCDIEADGMITTSRDIILGIYTADCIPILFCDTANRQIAAIHCGWKGLLAGIIQNTIAEFKNTDSLVMVIGACIHQDNYEVDDNFYENFIKNDQQAGEFFKKSTMPKKYFFNLPLYAYNISIKNGINANNIDVINLDTYKNEDLFFSHRRATHQGVGRGLQLSCITIKSKE